MSDEISQPMRTELFAASIRADKTELKTFLDALAIKRETGISNSGTGTYSAGYYS